MASINFINRLFEGFSNAPKKVPAIQALQVIPLSDEDKKLHFGREFPAEPIWYIPIYCKIGVAQQPIAVFYGSNINGYQLVVDALGHRCGHCDEGKAAGRARLLALKLRSTVFSSQEALYDYLESVGIKEV